MRYFKTVYTGLTGEQIVEMVESAAGPEGKEVIVTFAEEMKLKGRIEASAEVLLSLLKKRFGPVPTTARAKVEAADEATLSRWALRVLDASSLDEVLADRRTPARKPAARAAARR